MDPPLVTGTGQYALLVIEESPFNAEAAPHALASPITPAGAHYVRAHFGPPALSQKTHRIRVDGAVGQSLSLSLAELRARPGRSVTVTLECAGNQRLAMAPLPEGEPFGAGAVSTASWRGPSLEQILEDAGVRDDAVEILVSGADRGQPKDSDANDAAIPYARALPLEVARAADVILALEMNGRPLPIEHGAPVRLIVPGWYGMASVKWVARISALTQPFDGWFQRRRYVYEHDGQVRPVELMRVTSMVVAPAENSVIPGRRVDVWGWAWSAGTSLAAGRRRLSTGAAAIAGVDVSIDGGPFQPATLDRPLAPHAWRRFSAQLAVGHAGRHTLRSRARDAAGRVQPDVAEWNRYGYGNHAVRTVVFSSR
jgi:DMSO/TMAO reductase YedYZ molybdopterin-dependent catalytic subunit